MWWPESREEVTLLHMAIGLWTPEVSKVIISAKRDYSISRMRCWTNTCVWWLGVQKVLFTWWMSGYWNTPAEFKLDGGFSEEVTDVRWNFLYRSLSQMSHLRSFGPCLCVFPWSPQGNMMSLCLFCDLQVHLFMCSIYSTSLFHKLWPHRWKLNICPNDEEKNIYGYSWCYIQYV